MAKNVVQNIEAVKLMCEGFPSGLSGVKAVRWFLSYMEYRIVLPPEKGLIAKECFSPRY